jgi:hypothetical protein
MLPLLFSALRSTSARTFGDAGTVWPEREARLGS